MKKRFLGLLAVFALLVGLTGCTFEPQSEIVISNDYTYINGYTVTKIYLYDSNGIADIDGYEPKTTSGIFTYDGLPGGKSAKTSIYPYATGTVKLVCDYISNGNGSDGSVELTFEIVQAEETHHVSFCPDTANNDVPKLVLID